MTNPNSSGPPTRIPIRLDRGGVVSVLGSDGLARPVTVEALRGGRGISVRDLGAVGDGRSHPLSQRYRSLAAARADFPHATSLDDEIDWAATQAAIELVRSTGGGTVTSPAGTYLCNRSITFPPCRSWGVPGEQVNWIGDGAFATTYRWTTDLGPRGFAVHCLGRYEPEGMYEGLWQDIGLEGPGDLPRLGSAPARMSGWGWGARRAMVRCFARRFRAGLDIVGDHGRFQEVHSRENLYAVYFSQPNTTLFGDHLFEKCMFGGCSLAAIAVHPDTAMGGCTMLSCYVGGSPYAIMKEAGAGEAVMLGQSLFLNCMFEYCGNAWLHDENEPRRAIVRKTTFDTCYFQWEDRNRLTGRNRMRRAVWDIHRAEHVRWLQPKEPFALLPGDEALIRIEAADGCEIVGHVAHLTGNCSRAGRPLMHGSAIRYGAYRYWRLEEPGSWSGRFAVVAEGSLPVRATDVLEWAPNGRVRRCTAGKAPVAGICTMDAAPGDITVMAVAGAAVPVRSADACAEAAVGKGEDGAATAVFEGRGSAFGWAHEAGDGYVLVALRGLA